MRLSVENVTYSYPGTSAPALDAISFRVAPGEYVAIVGANGSGKSTLARCIAGLQKPDSGDIGINPDAVTRTSVPVAMVFQSPSDQIIAETPELDIAFGPENLNADRKTLEDRVSESVEAFKLAGLSRLPVTALSSGQKQLLVLADIYALRPGLLVLDEPSSMLTPAFRAELLEWLASYHKAGGTIIHITHDPDEAAKADRVLVMNSGKLVFDNPPGHLDSLKHEQLRAWNLAGEDLGCGKAKQSHDRSDSPPVLACNGISLGPLENFQLKATKGSITAIMGESGCGKSLLLEIIAGLQRPASGELFVAKDETVSLVVQESEGSLFEEFVADDVAFAPRNAGLAGEELQRRVQLAMDMAGLPFAQFAERRTFSLSGGEKRKAAIAGILAMDTSIILLDEPASGLDMQSKSHLLKLILDLKEAGKTILFTTNRPDECLIADSVISLPDPANPSPSLTPGIEKVYPVKDKNKTPGQASLEKLRKTSAGFYRNLDTPFHRLFPVGKYIYMISCVITAAVIQNWFWLAVFTFFECIAAGIAGYSFRKLGLTVLKILPWLIIIVLIQILFFSGTVLSFILVLRFIALLIPLSVFVFITSQTEIMYGMEDILLPLRLIRLPVRDISLLTEIIFRFLPVLSEDAARITAARIIRGAEIKKGLYGKVRSMISLLVPLILRTLIHAERFAESINARYYNSKTASRYLKWKISVPQVLFCLLLPVFCGLCIFLSVKIRI
ncbi:ATP-binding cassette domain-containing protein [Brucepastera parasyntrophica]|uniref:ATP-binding cassette domain-containing protein n=1 Tax=Brucepastera parasyntrophica TaxID=2880008 RepID=UPI002108B96A|nr:ATP-binding cassette domain-containing protein [Brucepastera parasyntrophica]ULQ59066.1 ATP-binding cassette domain-containing protein [Brucepastera parasyntrophica]